ncbi:MAG: type III pantothenate kinase [Burkholderiaceae bacterium]
MTAFHTLLIDIGNTRTKWRLVDPKEGFLPSDPQGVVPLLELERLGELWRGLPIQAAWIANVASADALASVRSLLETAQPGAEQSVLVATSEQAGVVNCYRKPERLGADRWAQLIGARSLYPGDNVLIASVGTATTIDLLLADGRFEGGVILPGIALMRLALSHRTAALPLARGHYVPLARNTDDAIASGILHAQAGAIERVLRESGLVARADPAGPVSALDTALKEAVCLLTGGDAALVLPRLPFFATIADNLVLRGLLEVAREVPLVRAKT